MRHPILIPIPGITLFWFGIQHQIMLPDTKIIRNNLIPRILYGQAHFRRLQLAMDLIIQDIFLARLHPYPSITGHSLQLKFLKSSMPKKPGSDFNDFDESQVEIRSISIRKYNQNQ